MTTAPSSPSSSSSSSSRHHYTIALVAVAIGCTPTAPPSSGNAAAPNLPASEVVCLHPGCTPDPGWALQNCAAAEAGVEFFQVPIVTFETPSNGQFVGQYMYGYVDGTSNTSATTGYQPVATQADRCSDAAPGSNHAFHLHGGPFLGWGGGIGVAMEHFTQDAGLCPQIPNGVANDFCVPYNTDPNVPGYTLSLAAMNLSKYDGVALWARRGPDSQPLLRVLVGTKDTDDDINFLMYNAPQGPPMNLPDAHLPLYCERVKECACLFQDAPCTYSATGDPATSSPPGYYCGAPGATPSYAQMAPASGSTGYANKCDVTMCNAPYPAYATGTDSQFAGKPCSPYTTRNGVLSSYCFDPTTDPPPASGDQQCGDHFTFPLDLTTEWQLFLVPFDTMYQQGWAKKAPYFDTTTISVVRLTWDAGYIDYWIDDIKFYRVKK